jgi:hypothetical protein
MPGRLKSHPKHDFKIFAINEFKNGVAGNIPVDLIEDSLQFDESIDYTDLVFSNKKVYNYITSPG